MKQVININFQGRVVPIEVTAFDILKKYTESLNRYFAAEEGKEEIINDIESRIGELFQERIKSGSTCITEDDVNAIIKSMGRPEDFETEQSSANSTSGSTASNDTSHFNAASYTNAAGNKRLYRDENDKVVGGVCSGLANYFGIDVVIMRIIFVVLFIAGGFGFITYLILWVAVPSTASTEIGGTRKKLYRDSDDKVIAGVCSGISNYFGVSVWIPRLLFLLPFLTIVTRWSHWGNFDFPNFIRLGFSPGALLVYIILWLVIPEATTTAEKLEMKGEKVDMNSIKNSVMEEIKGVQQRAEKFGKEASGFAKERGKTFGTEMGQVVRKSSHSFGDIIAFIFKVFAYFILGCLGFAFVAALFSLGIVAVGLFPLKDFLLTDGWQNVYAWGTLIFFIAVPIIGILAWIIRKLAKIKTNQKLMRVSFSALWIVGLVCFILLISSIARDFKTSSTITEQEIALSNPTQNKLEITSLSPEKRYFRNRWFRIEPFTNLDDDTAYVNNVTVHIIKSDNDSFRVTMMKLACGRNRRSADTTASLIRFNTQQRDSLLIVDKGIPINRHDKFRNQRIILTVYVPVGKQIRIDKSIGRENYGLWDDDLDIEFDGLEHGWDEGVDYVMKKDGLYSLDDKPADTWKNKETNHSKTIIKDKNGNTVIINSGDESDGDNTNENYRYNNDNNTTTIIDSLKNKIKIETKRAKDSLENEKNKIENQLKKIDSKEPEPTAMNSNTFTTYNPMLLMD
ncbi:MAG: PspC domain-containing protein [Bacteroidetes bacterium]|nr:PspC domain-containing protein [Bacteroidota bacterium]MBS1757600.1 PspC domain-containing protein [Bacteroidota bacterium]